LGIPVIYFKFYGEPFSLFHSVDLIPFSLGCEYSSARLWDIYSVTEWPRLPAEKGTEDISTTDYGITDGW